MTILFFSLDIFFQKICARITFSKSSFPHVAPDKPLRHSKMLWKIREQNEGAFSCENSCPCCSVQILCCCQCHFPGGCCLNDKQVKGQDSFEKNKSSQKTLKGLSTAARKCPPGVKRRPLNVQTEVPSEASLRFKAPFNLAWLVQA